MYALDPNAKAVLIGGDITASGSVSEWKEELLALARAAPDPSVPVSSNGISRQSHFRTDATEFGPYIRYFGVIGNHDVTDSSWLQNWNTFLPGQKSLGVNSSSGVYYSATYGDALFIALDSQRPSAAQTTWLKNVLSTSTAKWKFVAFHHPVYPCDDKSPFAAGLDWVKLFEQYRVDVVFVSHSHTFERTCPMKGGHCAPDGVVYLNSSGGGAPVRAVAPTKSATVSYNGRTDAYACTEVLEASLGSTYNFCHMEVAGCRLNINCYADQNLVERSTPYDSSVIDHCGQ